MIPPLNEQWIESLPRYVVTDDPRGLAFAISIRDREVETATRAESAADVARLTAERDALRDSVAALQVEGTRLAEALASTAEQLARLKRSPWS